MVTRAQDHHRLGEELIRRGLVDPRQWAEALRLHRRQNRPLPEVLVAMGVTAAEDLLSTFQAVLNLPVVDLKRRSVDTAVLKYIPEALARRHCCIPLELQGNALVVAVADPGNLQALEDLQAQAGVRLQPALGDAAQIREAIDLHYKATAEIEKQVQEYTEAALPGEAPSTGLDEAVLQTPVVRTLDLLLHQAVRDRASDVHVEPQPGRLRVRYRIDGVLQEVLSLPVAIHAPLVSRIKILAQMNIAERRLPQDGQFTFVGAGKEVDVRVATIGTAYGERAVLRLLDKSTSLLSLPELGFLPESLAQYQALLRARHGLILIGGPTGSGKTTTLYASVHSLDRHSNNIVTIEDPVEYRFLDMNQIQVNPRAGLTFAAGLRALMRHDPDVILVGEIRDSDTALTAVQAALTGHLVLSSIHANDTEGVLYRLMNLGVDPFLIASSVVGVVAQRMVRRVCQNCAVSREATLEEQLVYEREMHEPEAQFLYGQGCQFCAGTGYKGRTGVFEVMALSESLRRHVLAGGEPGTLKLQALKEGMTPMLRDGLIKAKRGGTSPLEVLRSVYSLR